METHVSISTGLYMTILNSMTCLAKVYSEEPEFHDRMPYFKKELAPQFKNLYPWIASDPDTRPILLAFIKRKNFIPDKKIWKRVKSSIEHGMYQRLVWTAETLELSQAFSFSIKKRPNAMRECRDYFRKLKIKELSFQALKIVNFEKFTLVFLAFISVCCMAYIVEVFMKERHTLFHFIDVSFSYSRILRDLQTKRNILSKTKVLVSFISSFHVQTFLQETPQDFSRVLLSLGRHS